jgi:hypothetical protein
VASGLDDGDAAIEVFDQLGKLVIRRTTTVAQGRLMEHVDVHELAAGLYILSVTDSGGKNVRMKFVKQ